ncbi:MAG: glycine cleavage system aminomethyltransferase GcvT [Candidatus Bipolaricaulia bacterium]
MKDNYDYQDLLVNGDLSEIDPLVDELIDIEEDRQARKLILIPSESVAPLPVREALGSVFNNVYAEGYPRDVMREETEDQLSDLTRQITHYRRYANRRFYKGTEFVDMVESLAGRRAKDAYANDEVGPEEIYANVQPLSGTAGNLAIYDSFVDPGDTVMGMALDQGGHLSHGSKFNLTGKRYNIVPYSTDPHTGRLDYDRIRDLAKEHKPKMIIAGYTSYSWAPDWDKFRSIADEVGAVLLADVSHVAGMVVAGAYPNPIGKAHVVMNTTHKTIGGPRGAIVLTTDKDRAEIIDQAIFPGAQGGPHPNKFAAMAVAFKIAQTETFKNLQHQIVDNAKTLAEGLQDNGLTLAYGGTDTHLMVINLKVLEQKLDFKPMGEIASRILDETRIVTNKNTIPGDESAAEAHGLRLGTPWITQRGMKEPEMRKIADIVSDVLHGMKSFHCIGQTCPLSRGKIDLDLMLEARERVADLLGDFPPYPSREEEYPEYYPVDGTEIGGEEKKLETAGAVDPDWPRAGLIEVKGHRPTAFLDQITTRDTLDLANGKGKSGVLLDENGDVLDRVELIKEEREGEERYLVITSSERKSRVLNWFRGISDGYVTFDKRDYMKKVEGPVKVYDLEDVDAKGEDFAVYGPVDAESFRESAGCEEFSPGVLTSIKVDGVDLTCYRSEVDSEEVFFWTKPESLAGLSEKLEVKGDGYRDYFGMPGPELYREKEGLIDLTRPYFVGQSELEQQLEESEFPESVDQIFIYESEESDEAEKSTPLLEKHKELDAKIAPFVGWEMPFWYSTIQEEHEAVREAAGLFDVGHMAVFEVKGKGSTHFLDCVASNYIRWMEDKEAQYNYFLDPEGRVVDDAMIYRITEEHYIIVANAANEDKDWQWLNAVQSGEYVLDPDRPWVKPSRTPQLTDLKSEEAGDRAMRDLALQGPESRRILQELVSPEEAEQLDSMVRNELDFYDLNGARTMVARTGYTGEEIGYELLVHPDDAPQLWDDLLDQGDKYGIKPAGLGARDSTRIEAGLPLYGHELSGEDEILPTEAGFGAYVKFHKPYFIGRDRYKGKAKSFLHVENKVVRFKLVEEEARMVREDSPVFDERGKYLGYVTSCAKIGGGQVGMAYVKKGKKTREGKRIRIVPSFAGKDRTEIEVGPGGRMPMAYEAEILPRFPETEEGVPGMESNE